MEHETKPSDAELTQASSEAETPQYENAYADLPEVLQEEHDVAQGPFILSRGSDDWHPDKDPAFRRVRSGALKSGEDHSIVRDGGLSLQFSDLVEGRSQEEAHDLTRVGAHLEEENIEYLLGPHDFNHVGDTEDFLDQQIMTARVPSAGKKEVQFLPFDALENLITPANITQELRRVNLETEVGPIAKEVWATEKSLRGDTSRKRIFAILCMIRKAAEIVSFIDEGIYDYDLPFIFKPDPREHVYRREENGSKEPVFHPIYLFRTTSWPIHDRDSFQNYQWQLLAPYFKLSYQKSERVLHFLLEERTILPFVEDVVKDQEYGATREGGFSIVRKVKLHSAHYNKPNTQLEKDVYFAIKELNVVKDPDMTHGQQKQREALALKRFNEQTHPHLIRLLATYTREGRFHMVFPWADGNLKDLWTSFPQQRFHSSDGPESIRWLSKQILGLAHALGIIHFCLVQDEEKPYGRHGDLKPENILWFQRNTDNPNDQSSRDLVIADFGFADFRSSHSRSYVRKSAVPGVTDTYKAPEIEVKKDISQSYDIWCFGCILLEFVGWFLQGWEAIDEFSKTRTGDSEGAILPLGSIFPEDTFFKLIRSRNQIVAKPKSSVTEEFAKLRALPACSSYLLDLLEIIQLEMLIVEPKRRLKIDDLIKTLGVLDQRCRQSKSYCVDQAGPARAISIDQSELWETAPESTTSLGVNMHGNDVIGTTSEAIQRLDNEQQQLGHNGGQNSGDLQIESHGGFDEPKLSDQGATVPSNAVVSECSKPLEDQGSTAHKPPKTAPSQPSDTSKTHEGKHSKRKRARDSLVGLVDRCFGCLGG